jgi:hypothetical protein
LFPARIQADNDRSGQPLHGRGQSIGKMFHLAPFRETRLSRPQSGELQFPRESSKALKNSSLLFLSAFGGAQSATDLRPAAAPGSFGGVLPHTNFFLFLVGRNSVSFAPACPRKSFVARRLLRWGGAKLSEFRPGGGAKLSPGGAKLVRNFAARASDVQNISLLLLDN